MKKIKLNSKWNIVFYIILFIVGNILYESRTIWYLLWDIIKLRFQIFGISTIVWAVSNLYFLVYNDVIKTKAEMSDLL